MTNRTSENPNLRNSRSKEWLLHLQQLIRVLEDKALNDERFAKFMIVAHDKLVPYRLILDENRKRTDRTSLDNMPCMCSTSLCRLRCRPT